MSCCTNKHMNHLRTKCYNKVVHVLANTLLVHPTARCFILINGDKLKTEHHIIPHHHGSSHVHSTSLDANALQDFPHAYYASSAPRPQQNPNLKVQIYEFTNLHNRFSQTATTRNSKNTTSSNHILPHKVGQSCPPSSSQQ